MGVSFHDVRLRKDYSTLAEGGPEYATAVVRSGLGGGVVHHNVNRQDFISRYTIPFNKLTSTLLDELRTFAILRRGRAYGFRFHAPDKNSMSSELAGKLNVSTGEVEQMTLTDGSTTVYYFGHYYSDAGSNYFRRIVKPSPIEAGSFQVYSNTDTLIETVAFGSIADTNGVIADSEVISTSTFGNVTIDYTQGKMTLTTAVSNKKIKLTCTYHLPVCFEDDWFKARIDIGGVSDLGVSIVELLPASLGIT